MGWLAARPRASCKTRRCSRSGNCRRSWASSLIKSV
nr:MAG TPA: hypothetical protein [Caudoviricetes sp.]